MPDCYNVIDYVPKAERAALGMEQGMLASDRQIMAVATNQFRTPKAGEWYLSGAIPEAYRAPNDLSIQHRIAKLVVVRKKVIWVQE